MKTTFYPLFSYIRAGGHHLVLQYVYSRVQWFFKLTMLHIVLDRQKISDFLEKAFFVALLSFFGFCAENVEKQPFWEVKLFFLEIGHIGYQKIESFSWFQKSKLVLVTKFSPPPKKKVKLKNYFLILLSPIFSCFNFMFWGAFCH